MAFTYDTTTARGRTRLLIGDTDTADSTKQIFEDAEVDAFLALEGQDPWGAAAAACESLATASARSAVMFRAERLFQIDRTKIAERFLDMARRYRERYGQTPVEELDTLDYRFSEFGQDASEYVGDTLDGLES